MLGIVLIILILALLIFRSQAVSLLVFLSLIAAGLYFFNIHVIEVYFPSLWNKGFEF